MPSAKFDWNQYPSEDSSDNAQGGAKFDWSKHPVEGQTESDNGPGFLTKTGKAILGGVAKVGQTIDRFGGAPTRAAIASLQDDVTQPGKAADAFKSQFGADPSLAPTGKDLVRRAGVPDTALSDVVPSMYSDTGQGMKLKRGGILDPTASGAAGVAMDVAADPMTYLPLGKIAKGIAGTAAKSADKMGDMAAATGRAINSGGTKAVAKVGSALTGVPEQEISTYIQKYPEVQKMIADHGDDISGAADQVRQSFQTALRSRRAELGKQVGQALGALPDEKAVPIAPVIDSMNQVKNQMNSTLRFEEAKQVDDLIGRIQTLAGEGGKVTPKEMYDIKEFLQDRGTGSYMKDGQIFVPGRDAQIAAKNGAAQARQIVNTMSPTVADANNELYKLHLNQDKMNKNLIAPGTPDAALLGAGSGLNARNAAHLQTLGKASGTDMLGSAQQYAAAKRFASPGLSAADSTGKGVERALKAGIVGQALGGPVAGAIAAAVTSPMALKTAIQAGRIPVEAIQKIAGVSGDLSDATIQRAYQLLKTPEGQTAFNTAIQAAKTEGITSRAAVRNVASPPEQQQSKGENLWAQQGIQKLGIQDQGLAGRLLQDPKAQRLLIQASALKPGSQAMKNVMNQIQKGWGNR